MRTRCLLLLVLLIVAMSVPGCSRGFKLATVPPDDIPLEIREAAEEWLPYQPAVWRACYEQEGYVIGVAFCFGGLFQQWAWFVFRDGQHLRIDYNIQTSDAPRMYAWQPQETLSAYDKTGESTYSIAAYGWAWDRAAYKVVGTTTQGRSFEGQVVNGFWILLDPDVEGIDRFEAVVLQDGNGKVLRKYDRTELAP